MPRVRFAAKPSRVLERDQVPLEGGGAGQYPGGPAGRLAGIEQASRLLADNGMGVEGVAQVAQRIDAAQDVRSTATAIVQAARIQGQPGVRRLRT